MDQPVQETPNMNQNLFKDTRAGINGVKGYMDAFVLAVLALGTLGIIAGFVKAASLDTNFTSAQVVMLGLIVLALIIGVVVFIFKTIVD